MKPAAGFVGNYLPTIGAVTAGLSAAPYVVPPIIRAYRSMFNEIQSGPPSEQDPVSELEKAFNDIRDTPDVQSAPAPMAPMNNSTSTSRIMALRQLLG
jgi:hypothetical protein